MQTRVHEIRNQLAVAMVNVEAFLDGKLEPNRRRLQAVMSALVKIDSLVDHGESKADGSNETTGEFRRVERT